eukprot:TRINITY_DN1862_c0_g1_i4.p1 TRINITY_DN1862_c0_g1~~TRINITY_DN1862_c0_g1_i4.p1  ORF type:complete len:297 (-),score=49.54 TRINITY_DN1862_c0_g1_i4:462-1325(-)
METTALLQVFARLDDARDLAACSRVCRLWRQLLVAPSADPLWQRACRCEWVVGEATLGNSQHWLDYFVLRRQLDKDIDSLSCTVTTFRSSPTASKTAVDFSVPYTADGKQYVYVGSARGAVYVWDPIQNVDEARPKGGKPMRCWTAHEGFVSALKCLRGAMLLTGSQDNTVKLWRNEQALQTFSGHESVVKCVDFLYASGTLISSGDDAQLKVVPAILNSTAFASYRDKHRCGTPRLAHAQCRYPCTESQCSAPSISTKPASWQRRGMTTASNSGICVAAASHPWQR